MYMHVFSMYCMYIQVCSIKDAQAEECNGITDDGVSSHVLADDSGIAAQINWQEQNVSAGMPLAGCISYFFVNYTGIYQIHTNTYIYMQIHANTCIPTWQSAPKSAVRPDMLGQLGLATAGKSKLLQASQSVTAQWQGHWVMGTGPETSIQCNQCHWQAALLRATVSQALVQVGPLVDSQSASHGSPGALPVALGHRDRAAGYDGIQVH
jgi:hypothetical protein